MLNFDLYPWELPREGISCEGQVAFELNVGGESCQFCRAESDTELFPYFRFSSSPDEHFLLARLNFWTRGRREEPVELRPAQYPVARFAQDESGLLAECQNAMELNGWGRYFCLRADLGGVQTPEEVSAAKWSVFLLANGIGVFDNLAHNRQSQIGFKGWNSMAPFRWHEEAAPQILRGGTALEWLDWVQEAARHPESTLAFAYEMAEKSEDEAAFLCAYWVNGNRQEWEKVARWILQTEDLLWENSAEDGTVQWSYLLTEAGEAPQREGGFLLRSGERSGPLIHEPTLKRLQSANNYFSPFLDPFLINRHLCVEYHRHHMKFLRVTANAPSNHERLEAALNLRDWAQDKLQWDEAKVLCAL